MSTGTPERPRHLIADIGGTHARFALCASVQDIEEVEVLDSADYPSMEDAIRHYLDKHGSPKIQNAVIGIANPILGDHIKMTNSPWAFSIEAMRKSLQLQQLLVLNDFTVLAMALPHLHADDLMKVGGGAGDKNSPLGLLGPGTGLGVSALIRSGGGLTIPLAAEGGHASFAPANDLELMLWRAAHKQFGHVSLERLISGSGLVFIYTSLCQDQGLPAQNYSPADISHRALAQTDATCRQALDTFCAILGTAASDLAVTLGARGGIYIGGGIIKQLGDYFAQSPFRARFEDKGRFRDYLAAIPVFVINSKQPALIGAAAYLETLEQI